MKLNKVLICCAFITITFTSLMLYSFISPEKMDKQSDKLVQLSVVNYPSKITETKESQIINLIIQGIESGNDVNIEISEKVSTEKILGTVKSTIINYGYGGYISNFQYSINGNNINVTFNYNDEKSETIAKLKAVNSKVEEIASEIIKPGMSNIEKEQAIHDYIVNNTSYDYDNYIKETVPEDSYNAYGVFFNKVAVCEGYAEAVYRLLNEAGIENTVITGISNGVDHAWNLVNIDGKYYHLDATYNDPINSTTNILSYQYFNLTDEEISKDHSWNKSEYQPSTNIKYDHVVIE
ncbi:MAG: transglutaminase domain-containing protein [Clostridiaceae bacterium]